MFNVQIKILQEATCDEKWKYRLTIPIEYYERIYFYKSTENSWLFDLKCIITQLIDWISCGVASGIDCYCRKAINKISWTHELQKVTLIMNYWISSFECRYRLLKKWILPVQ